MKISHVIILLAILLIGGLFGYDQYSKRIISPAWRGAVETEFRKAIETDTRINELVLKNRSYLLNNYDLLAKLPTLFAHSLDQLDKLLQPVIQNNNELRIILKQLRESFLNKIDALENFKSHNSLLRNSLLYAPIAGNELVSIAEHLKLPEDRQQLLETINNLLLTITLDDQQSEQKLLMGLRKLKDSKNRFPDYSHKTILEFENHGQTVLRELKKTDKYLQATLGGSTQTHIQNAQKFFSTYIDKKAVKASQYKYIILGYLLILGLSLIILGFRLHRLYQLQDQTVQERTMEVNNAYRSLKESQNRLLKIEKLTSLGQVSSNITQAIKNPIEQLRQSIPVIEKDWKQFRQLHNMLGIISKALAQKQLNTKKFIVGNKKVIREYRRLQQLAIGNNLENNFKNFQVTLNEIEKSLDWLNDFGSRKLSEKESLQRKNEQ